MILTTFFRHSGAKSRKQTYLIEEDPIGEDQMELDPINPEESVDFPFFGEGKRARDDDWRLHKYKSSNHTIKLMVHLCVYVCSFIHACVCIARIFLGARNLVGLLEQDV